MSEEVAYAVIEAERLEKWAKTFHSKGSLDSPLVREVKAHFSDDGVAVSVVDPANVAMVEDATIAPRGFESYDSPGTVTIGVNLTRLLDAIDPAGTSNPIELSVDMETRKLEVHYGNTNLSLALIDPEAIRKEPDSPDLDLATAFTLTGEQLKHAVSIADMMGDYLSIDADPDERVVSFYGEGDTDSATVEYGDEELIDASVPEETHTNYGVSYLDALTAPIPDDSEVSIRYGTESPMQLEWSAFDGAFTVGQTLAPRIDSS